MIIELPSGSSGSWVVNPTTFKVYGHVVAENPLGDIWVIPMCDMLNDIREEEHATSVRLAIPADISLLMLGSDEHIGTQAMRIETSIDTKQNMKTNTDQPSIQAQQNKGTVPKTYYRSAEGESTSNSTWVWHCCSCGYGPHNYTIDKICPFCGE